MPDPGPGVGACVVSEENQGIELRRVCGERLLDRVTVDRVIAGRTDAFGRRSIAAVDTLPARDAPALYPAIQVAGVLRPARKISGCEVSVDCEVGRGPSAFNDAKDM